jgi:predicted RNA-binding protein YlxR (DUF448 family)
MTKKSTRKPRHIPQRTCVGCRQVLEKRTLIRIVRTPDGIRIDPTGKLEGRGSYLHDQRGCWEIGMNGALAHSLKVDFSENDRELLKQYMEKLPASIKSEQAG